MGCGGSRLESDDDTAHPGLRPFRRRLDEIRHRRNGRTIVKDDTLSSKQLLDDEGEDGQHCPMDPPYCGIRMSVSSPPGSENAGEESGKDQSTPKKDATTEVPHHVPSSPKNDQNINDKSTLETDKPKAAVVSPGEEKERETEKGDKEGEEGGHAREREEDHSSHGDDEDGDGDGDGGFQDEDGREIGYGSPSFRDYFLSSAAGNATDSDSGDACNGEDRSDGVKENKPLRGKESSSDSNEGSDEKLTKKESKGRRFRNVLPKGKQGGGGVMHLLNVRSCYHPSSSCAHGGNKNDHAKVDNAAS